MGIQAFQAPSIRTIAHDRGEPSNGAAQAYTSIAI